jgi:phosphoenolpyruvate synthase/pyruvate phosphate dikinase
MGCNSFAMRRRLSAAGAVAGTVTARPLDPDTLSGAPLCQPFEALASSQIELKQPVPGRSTARSRPDSEGSTVPAFTIPFSDLGKDSLDLVGGKGANLGELRRVGMPVPDGFCLTTRAFRRFVEACPDLDKLYAQLEQLDVHDRMAVGRVGADLRSHLLDVPMPADVRAELLDAWHQSGDCHRYAVRSSATAEDLAEASFAGQYDSYLNVSGEGQLLDSVRRCWLSLFTDRAIGYRGRLGFDHRRVELAVVVQRMVVPRVAGVMFTADPVSGHRRTIVVNAAYGLGEAVVSGLVNPDLYRIEKNGSGHKVHKSISDKRLAVTPLPSGGVGQQDVPETEREAQALPDEGIEELADLGRRIQDHFGAPQDIEWAWADGRVQVLQSRPITSLYPTPEAPADRRLHVYFSFGHQQMMTDAMKPLGLSVLRTFFPFGKRLASGESTQMALAGNRLFFDYTEPLHSPLARRMLARAAGSMDKRVGNALSEIASLPGFREHHRFNLARELAINAFVGRTLARILVDVCWTNMNAKQAKTQAFMERTLAHSRAAVEQAHGAARIAAIQQDLMRAPSQMYYRMTLPQASAMVARNLLERLCQRWLGEIGDVAPLDKSLPGNVTTEMALAIGDLADLARDKPALLGLLQSPPEPFSLHTLDSVPGGAAFRDALGAFLDRYGIRGPGEVDLTRVRWADQPTQLFAGILANTRTGGAGEHRQRFLAAERETEKATGRILGRIRTTRLGRPKAAVMSRLITVYRTLMGLREHQKFLSVSLFDIYRRAIRAEADSLTDAGVLASTADADYLTLHELRQILDGQPPADLAEVIRARMVEHEAYQALTPPRLSTSDGEVLTGARAEPGKEGVLIGCPVSAGVADGRARVVLRSQDAELHDGDILVARFTDPAWTPLFSAVRGIVLEIGGVMTHGAVIARELGIPAVVGINDATRLIPDGQHIRVDGSQGVVELIRTVRH